MVDFDSLNCPEYGKVIDISSTRSILDGIGELLRDEEWNSELFELIAQLLRLEKELYAS